jgi:hypothetical protein
MTTTGADLATATVARPIPVTPIPVTLWRHRDPASGEASALRLGDVSVGGDAVAGARAIAERGARRVVVTDPVDLLTAGDGEVAVRALTLVRELTSYAVHVDWRLVPPAGLGSLAVLGHLYPPTAVFGAGDSAALLADWRSGFHLDRCMYRVGPGFIQVRDRRWRFLHRITIDAPDYLAAVETVAPGAPVTAVPAGIAADLAAENLVLRVGEAFCWLPYRVHRWPMPAMGV